MPNVTGDNLTFNIDGITDNQILVYDSTQGIFVAQDSVSADANAAVTGGSNVGASGIGLFSAKDGSQLNFKKIQGSGATTVTESANVITVSSTAYTIPTPLSIHNVNGNTNIFSGRNFGDNANITAYAGILNNANYPTHSQSAGFDSKTRFVISSNDAADVELSSQHSLILATKSTDGHIEVRSANSTVFYVGSASSTTPALKINSNRSTTFANAFTLPTSDGTNGQVLVTNGSGGVSWTTLQTGGLTASQLTANLANYIPKNATSMPDTTMSYDIGNSNYKYLNIFANRFRGTADAAIRLEDGATIITAATLANAVIKTNNLSDLPNAATARTNLGVYSKAEVDANISSAQLQNAISTVTSVGSANTISATSATHAIRFEGGTGIGINQYTANNTIQISKTDAITGVFKNVSADGILIIADNNNDTLNLVSGSNVSFTANPGTDTITIDATLDDSSIDKYTKAEVNTAISSNVSALRYYKSFTGDSGSTDASAKDDTFNIVGGTGITTVVTGDTVTINNTQLNDGIFKNISVAGQDLIIADNNQDTLNFVAGSGISITADASTDTITINNTGGGGGGGAGEAFKTVSVQGGNSVVANVAADQLTFIAGANATISADSNAQTITIDATGGGGAGVKGDTGATGPAGSDGAKGQKGELGDTGATGATGPQGAIGNTGPAGANGDKGSKGDQGAQGVAGNTGDKGAQGNTGATGPQGATGPAGNDGAKGEIGPQGPAGNDGSKGEVGATGPQGNVGPTGPQGPTGTKGEVGATGPQGQKGEIGAGTNQTLSISGNVISISGGVSSVDISSALDSVDASVTVANTSPSGSIVEGDLWWASDSGELYVYYDSSWVAASPAGDKGQKGDDGLKGEQGVTGAQGTTGAQGVAGPTGPQGSKGDTGPQGPTGAQGATGPQGAQGQKGATGADSTVAGPQGNTGPTGPQGTKGDTGATGNNGSDGSDGAKGQKGELGPQGATGPQGGQGTKGEVGPQGTVGATGPTGPQGNVGGTGPTGSKGDKGELGGPTGPTGDKGEKGQTGAQGAAGADGSTGSDGAQGPAGDKGQKGEASTVAGPTGPAGATGPTGPAGSGSAITVQDEGSSLATAASTLNFVGSGVVASGSGTTKTITISGGGGGGSVTRGNTYERLKLNYNTSGELTSISNVTAGINATTITSAAGAELEVQFTGFDYPPVAIMAHGYQYASNKYSMNAVSGDWTTRTVDGGGSSGSPTAFGSFSTDANVDLKVSEAITGASRSFGTSTHAWITFVMAE